MYFDMYEGNSVRIVDRVSTAVDIFALATGTISLVTNPLTNLEYYVGDPPIIFNGPTFTWPNTTGKEGTIFVYSFVAAPTALTVIGTATASWATPPAQYQ